MDVHDKIFLPLQRARARYSELKERVRMPAKIGGRAAALSSRSVTEEGTASIHSTAVSHASGLPTKT